MSDSLEPVPVSRSSNDGGGKGSSWSSLRTAYVYDVDPQQICELKKCNDDDDDVNVNEQQQYQHQHQHCHHHQPSASVDYHWYPYPYYSNHRHRHRHHSHSSYVYHTPSTTKHQQQNPQPHHWHNSNAIGIGSYSYPAWGYQHQQYHPPPLPSPPRHSNCGAQEHEHVQGRGASQSKYPRSSSRGYSYTYPYQYQQPQSHWQLDMPPYELGVGEEASYMEPHRLFGDGDEYYTTPQSNQAWACAGADSLRCVDEYFNYENKTDPESESQARARADMMGHVGEHFTTTAPELTLAKSKEDLDSAPATATATQAWGDSHSNSKNKDGPDDADEDEDEDVEEVDTNAAAPAPGHGSSLAPPGDGVYVEDDRKPAARRNESPSRDPAPMKPPPPSLPPMPSNQFTNTASESDKTHQSLEPLPFSSTPDMTSASATMSEFRSQLESVLFQPSPKDVSPPKKKRRRGRHPLSVPELVLPPTPPTGVANSKATTTTAAAAVSKPKHSLAWERKITQLLEHKKTHGHCNVPQTYPPNPSLGAWVNRQRLEHKKSVDGEDSSLTSERQKQLESIGFTWAKRKGQACWEEKFKQLEEYKTEHGDCNVPTKYKHNTALGRWVSTQRSEFKKFQRGDKKAAIDSERISRLESIGFIWFPLVCEVAKTHYSESRR